MNDAERVITEELGRYMGSSLYGKARVMIPCPFHKEYEPSLIINLKHFNGYPPGHYYCFGCKASSEKSGGWNALAKLTGMKQLDGDSFVQKRFSKRPEKIKAPETLREMLDLWRIQMAIQIPNGTRWRGFPAEFLNRTGALMGVSEHYNHKGIVMPVYVGDDLVGAVFCAYDKKAKPKYANSPGVWAKEDGVFMLHFASKMLQSMRDKYLVITEGPRDCLRLLMNGIPAIAILGVNTWSDTKTNLLLMQDIDRIVLAMDNDAPGIKGAADIRKFIAGKCKVQSIKYPEWEEQTDPASVSARCLRFWIDKYRLERAKTLPERSDFNINLA